jgi:hypothetical protein
MGIDMIFGALGMDHILWLWEELVELFHNLILLS